MLDDRVQRAPISEEEWCLGQRGAPLTLLEYGDFECPHCALAHPVLERLVTENPETTRLIYRHFPVTTIHPLAMNAAEAAEAAGAQGKFWEMHDLLFAHQPRFDLDHLRRLAHAIHLQMGQFDREMSTHAHVPEVKRDIRRGIEDGVNGTPTLFINRMRYDGPREYDAMLAAIALQTA
jgi:protein-disulfide isomerase